ncbi:hypothetical protein C2G38_2028672 [Gigaspora rosea]|uniref:Uncharacterized protein n=1 Tax=Gigaspora rosea TaxID=44941 RepID=A0A397W2I0_9GLOM|nr:hypothetical protein C2G38_2028672 [Gigaspora rosea]
MSNNEQNTRDVSKDPQQVSQPTTATNTGQHWTELSIDPNIKLYIDESICAATTLVISQLSSKYTDSLFDKQRLWNEQLQTNINNSLAQMVRSSMHGGTLTRMDSSSSVDLMDSPQQRQRPSCTSDSPQSMDKGKETVPASGKYPPTPVLNDLIARASKVSIQGQTPPVTAPPTASAPMRSIITPAVVQLFKMTPRKYPSFDYTKFKNMYEVQGFSNPQAARTEMIRLWWVTNWSEGQKMIESLPYKPSISIKLWKAVAFGSYVNLQDFTHKNMLSNIKEMDDEPILQTEGGTISVKKCTRHMAFADISEWLLVFKS